jgi:GT2 family glycosyltransferase
VATVDIIIPHYGRGQLTEVCLRCLETIREHSSDYRVILVDNASEEPEPIAAELERHAEHLLLRNSKNLGFIKAVNQGLAASTAPFVVLMNNDTEAVPQWLEKLRRALHRHPRAGLAGPLTTTPDSWQGRWTARGSAPYLLGTRRMLAFFCVMIRREVLDVLPMLDENYGVGFGDDDKYCADAEAAGFRLALAQDLRIPHHHRTTFKALYTADQIKEMQAAALAQFKQETGRE